MTNGNIPFRTMIDLVETANRIDESGGDIDYRQVIMRRISQKIAQVVNELADDLHGGAGYDWGDLPRMQPYSGRGMYGKYCLGVSVGRYASTDLLKRFKKNGIPDPSRDQLGMGHIYYWQNIPHDPVIHKNYLKDPYESVESADMEGTVSEGAQVDEAKNSIKSMEAETFEMLRVLFAKWQREGKRFDPESPAMKALLDFLDTAPKGFLKKLANANIGFFSDLAKNRLRSMGKTEEVESADALTEAVIAKEVGGGEFVVQKNGKMFALLRPNSTNPEATKRGWGVWHTNYDDMGGFPVAVFGSDAKGFEAAKQFVSRLKHPLIDYWKTPVDNRGNYKLTFESVDPLTESLDVYLRVRGVTVYDSNTTHNHGKIAKAVNPALYTALWQSAGMPVMRLAPLLKTAIKELETNGDKYRHLDNPNNWGSVDHFLIFLKGLYAACIQNPRSHYQGHT